jgi:hypothetical protein
LALSRIIDSFRDVYNKDQESLGKEESSSQAIPRCGIKFQDANSDNLPVKLEATLITDEDEAGVT